MNINWNQSSTKRGAGSNMTKQQAEALYKLTNSPLWTEFVEYQKDLLEKARDELEWKNKDSIEVTQGKIAAIRDLLMLKEKVNSFFENN